MRKRVVFLGAPHTGKTSLLTVRGGGQFNRYLQSSVISTCTALNDSDLDLIDFPLANSERELEERIQSASGLVLVWDLTHQETLEEVERLLERMKRLKEIPVLFIGNKSDLSKFIDKRYERIYEIAKTIKNFKIIFASAKDNKCGEKLRSQKKTIQQGILEALLSLLKPENPQVEQGNLEIYPALIPIRPESEYRASRLKHSRQVRFAYLENYLEKNTPELEEKRKFLFALHAESIKDAKSQTTRWIGVQGVLSQKDYDTVSDRLGPELRIISRLLEWVSKTETSFSYKLTFFEKSQKALDDKIRAILNLSEKLLDYVWLPRDPSGDSQERSEFLAAVRELKEIPSGLESQIDVEIKKIVDYRSEVLKASANGL